MLNKEEIIWDPFKRVSGHSQAGFMAGMATAKAGKRLKLRIKLALLFRTGQ